MNAKWMTATAVARVWKIIRLLTVILSRRRHVAEGEVPEDGRRTPSVLASSEYRPPVRGYQEGGPSTVLRDSALRATSLRRLRMTPILPRHETAPSLRSLP